MTCMTPVRDVVVRNGATVARVTIGPEAQGSMDFGDGGNMIILTW